MGCGLFGDLGFGKMQNCHLLTCSLWGPAIPGQAWGVLAHKYGCNRLRSEDNPSGPGELAGGYLRAPMSGY